MAERSYTVQEIDALRRVVDHHFIWGRYDWRSVPIGSFSHPYREDEKARIVEERVRTFMLAGHTAETLVASEGVSQ